MKDQEFIDNARIAIKVRQVAREAGFNGDIYEDVPSVLPSLTEHLGAIWLFQRIPSSVRKRNPDLALRFCLGAVFHSEDMEPA